MNLEIFSELTLSFFVANIVAELVKYLTVKAAIKIDSLNKTFLD